MTFDFARTYLKHDRYYSVGSTCSARTYTPFYSYDDAKAFYDTIDLVSAMQEQVDTFGLLKSYRYRDCHDACICYHENINDQDTYKVVDEKQYTLKDYLKDHPITVRYFNVFDCRNGLNGLCTDTCTDTPLRALKRFYPDYTFSRTNEKASDFVVTGYYFSPRGITTRCFQYNMN